MGNLFLRNAIAPKNIMKNQIVLGVDIGGTGIKGGLIDIETGTMVSERHRIPTPQPPTVEAVAETFKALVKHFSWDGSIGVGFPAIIRNGTAYSASNIDKKWIGTNVQDVLSVASRCPVYVVNDADAAGIASKKFGVGKNEEGVVILLTIGTGIGSAIFSEGHLVPNTELGSLFMPNQTEIVEKQLSNKVRKENEISWEEWGALFNKYLIHLERLYSPSLFIIGGGGSKRFDKYKDQIHVNCVVKSAQLLNQAGAIGAAYYAWQKTNQALDISN